MARAARRAGQGLEAGGVLAAVGDQARGQIHAQRRRGAGLHPGQPLRQTRVGRVGAGLCRKAYAQQCVNAQVLRAQLWRLAGKVHAGVQRALPGLARVGGQRGRCAQPGDDDRMAGAVQQHGCLQPVAAVVAAAAGDPDAARMWRQGQRQARRGAAGALHQGVLGQGRGRGGLDAARGRRVM